MKFQKKIIFNEVNKEETSAVISWKHKFPKKTLTRWIKVKSKIYDEVEENNLPTFNAQKKWRNTSKGETC